MPRVIRSKMDRPVSKGFVLMLFVAMIELVVIMWLYNNREPVVVVKQELVDHKGLDSMALRIDSLTTALDQAINLSRKIDTLYVPIKAKVETQSTDSSLAYFAGRTAAIYASVEDSLAKVDTSSIRAANRLFIERDMAIDKLEARELENKVLGLIVNSYMSKDSLNKKSLDIERSMRILAEDSRDVLEKRVEDQKGFMRIGFTSLGLALLVAIIL